MSYKINSLEDYIEKSKDRLVFLESEKNKDKTIIEEQKLELEALRQSNQLELSLLNKNLQSKNEEIKLKSEAVESNMNEIVSLKEKILEIEVERSKKIKELESVISLLQENKIELAQNVEVMQEQIKN